VAPVAEGLDHDTYRVDAGDAYVLQVAGADAHDDASLRRGVACYRLLAATAVPVPRVVAEGVVDGRPYALVERLPGETPVGGAPDPVVRSAGRTLARVHDARGFDAAGPLSVADGEATPGDGSPDTADPGADAATLRAAGMDAAADALAAVDPPVDRPPAVLCHGDFSPDNVLARGGEVTGVVDFDRAHAGDAARDLALAATAFWVHDPTADRPVRRALYEGYRAVRPLDGFDAREPRLRAVTLGAVVAGLDRRGELTDRERAFYDDAVAAAARRATG
jgi:homoserine kinase type II